MEASVKTLPNTSREAAGADDLSVDERAGIIAGRGATGAWEHIRDSISAPEGVTDAFQALFDDHQIPTQQFASTPGVSVPGIPLGYTQTPCFAFSK